MTTIRHEFVEAVPEKLESGVLYVSIRFATAMHLCACGCGGEVVTPLSPTDWELRYDGESVSLYPSIGNWSFDCRSHYWIMDGTIEWAENWTNEAIAESRKRDRVDKIRFYDRRRREAEALLQRAPRGTLHSSEEIADDNERKRRD